MMGYLVPDTCIRCDTPGYIEPTVRTPGGAVVIFWLCRRCHHVWPVKQHEQAEDRRDGAADRRRQTRADRRKQRGF